MNLQEVEYQNWMKTVVKLFIPSKTMRLLFALEAQGPNELAEAYLLPRAKQKQKYGQREEQL